MNNNDKLDKGTTREGLKNAIAQAIRDHIKVDATGLAPTIVSAFIFGFDEAAEAALTAALADHPRETNPVVSHEPPKVRHNVDALAQEIRRVDGSNSLGAGALAEALMPWIDRLQPVAPPAGQEVSVDISTGDHDYDRRAFGKLTGEVNHSGIGDVWLAEGYVNQPIDIARIRAEAVAEERERIAAWIEPQRRDIPGHGWEFAAAIRASANEAPR